jgi:DNA-binding IclR family transcriptional regulator
MATTVTKKTTASRGAPKKPVDRQFVTALARGLAVLRCFDAIRPQLGTTEIAQMTKLPQPTVWRLCHTLQQLGYLVQAPNSDKLCIGMGVLGLGQFALGSSDIGEMVLPEMTQIAKLSGAAVSLGVVDQDEILIVKRAQGDGPLLMNLAVGSRLAIATSSAGWSYLAALPPDAREETLLRLKHQYSGKWAELRAAIEVAAKGLASTGFVMNEGFYHSGVSAVGAPACDKTGKPQYVITCGGPLLKPRFMREEVGPQVARLARKITVALAGRSSVFG